MSEQGAIDADFDDAERPYEQRVAEALADVRTEPVAGGVAQQHVQLMLAENDITNIGAIAGLAWHVVAVIRQSTLLSGTKKPAG